MVPAAWGQFGRSGALGDTPFTSTIRQHYLTNPICRASVTMEECTAVGQVAREGTGTHG